MKQVLPLSLILVTTVCSAELYKWTDEDGVVHYTDRMPTEQVQQQAVPDHLKSLGFSKPPQQTEPESIYSKFLISLPAADAIVRSVDATVNIVVQIDPPLVEDHFLQVYLDGLEVGDKTKSTALTLQKMKKGVHRLQAQVVDKDGQQVLKSEEISFEYREPADLTKIAPNLVSKPVN